MSDRLRQHLLARGPEPRAASLDLSKLGTLDGIEAFPSLEAVYLAGGPCPSLGPLAALPRLASLLLPAGKAPDLAPLTRVVTLRKLSLADAKGDVSGVRALLGLRDLTLPDGVKDLSFLTELTELDRLTLGKGWEGIEGLGLAVRELSIATTTVADLGPIASLPRLAALLVGKRRSAVSDLAPVARVPGLERFSLPCAKVKDLTPLVGCVRLRELELGGNKGVADLTPLSALLALERLDLNLTAVADLTPLSDLSRLRVLLLRGTRVASLKPLSGLTGLEELLAEMSKLRSLDGVQGLRALRRLWIFGTKVKDLEPLGGLERLAELNVAGLGAVAGTDVVKRLPALARLDVFETAFDPELLRGRVLEQVRGCDYPLPGSVRLDEPSPTSLTSELGGGSVLDGRLLSVRAANEIVGLALSPDGRELAFAARGAAVRRIVTADGAELAELSVPAGERATGCAYDATGALLIATRGATDTRACRVWRARGQELTRVAELRMAYEPRLAAHPRRPWVAVFGEGARVYDAVSGRELLAVPQDGALHATSVGAFAGALPRVYVHGAEKGKVVARDLDTGTEVGRWDAAYDGGELLSVSDDGRWLVSVGGNCYGASVVDTTTGQRVYQSELRLGRHGGAFVVTPDGTLLAECYHSLIGRRLPPDPREHVACAVPVAGRIVPGRACVSANGSMLAFSTFESRLGDARAFLCPIGTV